MSTSPYRQRVLLTYKQMLYLGKDYPEGFHYYRKKLNDAFKRNAGESDPSRIEQLLFRANYVMKEIEALYMLRKYRAMKNRYYSEETQQA